MPVRSPADASPRRTGVEAGEQSAEAPLERLSWRGPLDKSRGAYYTERNVAAALCRWAIRGPCDRVLDPAFGGGVFLEALLQDRQSGGTGPQVHGVEVHPATFARTGARLADLHEGGRLLAADFFELGPDALPPMEAVVGNPPFIRFQRFRGRERELARERARAAGVDLTPLAGSWVAFVAHACSFLATGGRLAMVVPAELGHAPYARPLLAMLGRRFREVTFTCFEEPLFPHLDQDTLLLLADGNGMGPGRFRAAALPGPEALHRPLDLASGKEIDGAALITGRTSLIGELLDPRAMALYRDLRSEGGVNLGSLATIESGYVTGANSHFHLSPARARELELPASSLLPALFRSRGLRGLRFGQRDWQEAAAEGSAGYLAQVAGQEEDRAVARFLAELEDAGVPKRYKARTRSPWYRIARVVAPPLILASMGARRLGLAVNDTGVRVPNTFHAVALRNRALRPQGPAPLAPEALALAWLSSLTWLSTELEGHALGGGMIKLDPGEASRVLLPPPRPGAVDGVRDELARVDVAQVDTALRNGDEEAARATADRALMVEPGLLARSDVERLAAAADALRARRSRARG